jgi:hypothetical protein
MQCEQCRGWGGFVAIGPSRVAEQGCHGESHLIQDSDFLEGNAEKISGKTTGQT